MTTSQASATTSVFKIVPTTQQYDWGKIGRDAKVAQFAQASQIPGFVVDDGKPYAELWMGTHPSSPSKVKDTGELLSEHLARHQELIGSSIISKFENAAKGDLPYLFKVLSIAKALSIQSHPDKATAQKLHAQSPGIYKDPNHKPEMVLALTDFQALCGFRPLADIAQQLRDTPELSSIIPATTLDAFYAVESSSTPEGPAEKQALRDLFSAVMTLDEPQVTATIQSIITRYSSRPSGDLQNLILRLQTQFPNDIGILCPYLLNYLHLTPGEAIFLGAGEPHAYIFGEAIECMANSDNVIRAGLTPKLRDLPNLVAGLTYRPAKGEKHQVTPSNFGDASLLYDPPIEEFSVVKVDVAKGKDVKQRAVDGPSIALVTDGSGSIAWAENSLSVSMGDVVFIGARTPIAYTTSDGVTLYRALVEV